ncbi:MAG TPA: hypothetical protein DCY48_00355 [Candidatus Magasanikbacteria bacterium]|nr:MAG: hypothetical protein A3I74_02745 [Candidatus Magasanikbacteria bacterium RIFCSPLOWO2_02_FULL_47_16]OGH79587.1 MAG: hypothetical protein A3C10_00655 [Candidatus Magasanikbacteria bacterium RIFCSPHIGHO2_02_FULL_48_18]OGH82839.1 MAG: hypothetical protein A3G08_02900 [Candidatus Magasanikbacteria bacterium RIFCSPLOWO2_12_FULL_47_9b]HAZ28219.1 hypothetical protein [Candidatus Magasanikbacteria bacterium]
MTHFLKQKNRPLIAGATMGLFLSLALLAINVYINAPSENSLINRGYAGGEIGYELGLSDIVLFLPTLYAKHLFETLFQLGKPIRGVGFFVFHIAFYILLGVFIGWIVYKVKKGKKVSHSNFI